MSEELKEYKETAKSFIQKLLRIELKKWHKLPYLKRLKITPKDELQFTLIGEKAVYQKLYEFKAKSPLPKKVKPIEGTDLDIDESQVFKNPNFNIFEKLQRKIVKHKERFAVFFLYDRDTKKINPVKLLNSGNINGHTLYVASTANVYKRAVGELLANTLGEKGKYIIYMVVIAVVVVGIALAYPFITQAVTHTAVNNSTAIVPSPTPNFYYGR